MRKIICDNCAYTAYEPIDVNGRTFHEVILSVETRYHVSVTVVKKDWCSECVKKCLGAIPEPVKDPPPKSEQLFYTFVEAVAEELSDDN